MTVSLFHRRLPLIVGMFMLLGGPAAAQDAPTTEPPGASGEVATSDEAPANPHEMLDAFHGGPDGSPTARRGNPRPGTSTSIPTMHPAPVQPLEIRRGEEAVSEDTGLDGQCDPVVTQRRCPELPR